jgi:hypothetical protein
MAMTDFFPLPLTSFFHVGLQSLSVSSVTQGEAAEYKVLSVGSEDYQRRGWVPKIPEESLATKKSQRDGEKEVAIGKSNMVVCRAIALRLSSGDNYMLAIKIFHL